MATNKKKKEVKVRDLKPSKDAKGGMSKLANNQASSARFSAAKLTSAQAGVQAG